MLLLDPIFVDCLPKNLKILSNLPASQPASQQDGCIIEPQNQTVNGARRLQVLLKGRERSIQLLHGTGSSFFEQTNPSLES